MGLHTTLFRDPGDVLSALTCTLCQHVLLQPFQVLCEQDHIFCKACLDSYVHECLVNAPTVECTPTTIAAPSSNPPHSIATAAAGGFLATKSSTAATAYESIAVPCPECKKQSTDPRSPILLPVCAFRPAKFAERLVQSQTIRCPTTMVRSCQWVGPRADMERHLGECPYAHKHSCPHHGYGCQFEGTYMDLLIHLPSCHYCSKSLANSSKTSESSHVDSVQEAMTTSSSSLPRHEHGQLSPPPSSPVIHAQSGSNVFRANDKQEEEHGQEQEQEHEQKEDEDTGSRDQQYHPGAELSLSYHLYGDDLEDLGDLDDILYGDSYHHEEDQDQGFSPLEDGEQVRDPAEEQIEDLDMADMTLSPGPSSPVPPNSLEETTEIYLPQQQILQQDPSLHAHVNNTPLPRRRRLIQEEEEEEEEVVEEQKMDIQEPSETDSPTVQVHVAGEHADDQELPRSQHSDASSNLSEALYISQEEFQPGQRLPSYQYGSPSPVRIDPPRNPQSRNNKDPQSSPRHTFLRDSSRHKPYRIPSPSSQNGSDSEDRRHRYHYHNHNDLTSSSSQQMLTSPSGSSRSNASPEAQLANFLALTQPAPYRIGNTGSSQLGHSYIPLLTHVPRYMKSRRKMTARERRRSGINLIEIALAQQYGQGDTPDITSPENSLDPSDMTSNASQPLL
ncbi:hypothetical protein EMPS_00724 [Entomortierella parvispora]|uniref:RING-type domain-containing protein n=1 Tax=Entomortierella parvispora TaxID=205924 RepID=A0A9P3LRX5_9FUNG|nr:hypothetical protein EMPS_00724 [Entomortierella parvispora]